MSVELGDEVVRRSTGGGDGDDDRGCGDEDGSEPEDSVLATAIGLVVAGHGIMIRRECDPNRVVYTLRVF